MKKEKIYKFCVIAFFIAFFVYGCLVFKDYGISYDEDLQRRHSLVNYKYLVPSVENVITETVDFPSIGELAHYAFYGVAVQLPAVLIEHIFHFNLGYREIYLVRHFWTFFVFFISTIFFYKTVALFSEKRWIPLLGTAFFILSPRILADSFYNIKDSMALSIFTISLFYAMKSIYDLKWKNFLPMLFFGALSSNIRIVGAIVMVAAYLCLLVKGIREKQIKKYFNYLCIGAVIFFVFFALLTPRLWAVDRKSAIASLSPEHWILLTSGFWNKICQIFSRLWATVMTFANYSYWQGSSLFLGRYYRSNELPIYYLPVWILVTTPVCYSVFAGVGTIGSISSVISPRRKKWSNKQFGMTFLLLLLVIPFAYIIIFRPSLYNGWRHFYFIYAVIILLSVWGVQFLLEWLSGKKWCVCILGTITVCSLCLTITWIIRNHPYEYVYFNMPVHDFIIEKMEKDYWSVSERDCLEYICKTDTRENITYFSYSGKNELMLSKADSNRLNLVSTNEVTEADYYLHFPGYSMEKDEFPHRGLFEEVYSTQVDGEKISAVFKRINQIVYENQIQQRNQNLYYQIAGIDWKRAENGKSIVGILKKAVLTNRITIETESLKVLQKLKISVSSDGTTWIPVTEDMKKIWGNTICIDFAQMALHGVKIEGMSEEDTRLKVTVIEPITNEQKFNESVIAKGQGECNPDLSGLAYDGDIETRWHTGVAQKECMGTFFDIELSDIYSVSGIQLLLGKTTWDYPERVRIFTSTDGLDYTERVLDAPDRESYYFDAVECKYIRLILVEAEDKNQDSNWSISEIKIYSNIN